MWRLQLQGPKHFVLLKQHLVNQKTYQRSPAELTPFVNFKKKSKKRDLQMFLSVTIVNFPLANGLKSKSVNSRAKRNNSVLISVKMAMKPLLFFNLSKNIQPQSKPETISTRNGRIDRKMASVLNS